MFLEDLWSSGFGQEAIHARFKGPFPIVRHGCRSKRYDGHISIGVL